jgi:outer membrane protein TolC
MIMNRTLLPLAILLVAPLAAAAPLTLDDALALAARQSRDLDIARADAQLAGADGLLAWQGVLPRLDLTSSAGHQFYGPSRGQVVERTTGRLLPHNSAALGYEAYSFGLQLTQPLVDLGALRKVSQARASERAASRSYDESRLGVAFDVTRRFFELVKAERTLQVLEKAAARSGELVERADALFGAGRAQKIDTFNARVNLGNDRILVEQGRTRLVQARADLALALGQPGDEQIEVVAPAAVEGPGRPSGELPPLEALMVRARERRPSLAAATAQVEAAEASLSAARFAYWPTLSAQASYDRSGTYALDRKGAGGAVVADGTFADPARNYSASVGLLLSWNLFAGRSTEAGVARAEASTEKVRATAGKTSDGVAREVTSARQTVVALAAQVGLSADNLTAAEQSLTLARQRLEAGLASQLEVRDASLKFTQAELSLVQARIDHAVAIADLARAVGGAI